MPQNIIGHCPVCNNQLVATKLTCHQCGLELSNDFALNKFSFLSEDDLAFVELFIHYSGNLREIQKELHLSYPAAKKRLSRIQETLGFGPSEAEKAVIDPVLTNLPVYQDESIVVKKIKHKLNLFEGVATVTLAKGESFQIYYEDFGNGIYATNLPHHRVITWSALNAAIELLTESGGKAIKGNAMKGKLGSTDLPLNSVEGYIAVKAYGAKKGDSCLRMISSVAAILEWCGICKNGYGYLELISD